MSIYVAKIDKLNLLGSQDILFVKRLLLRLGYNNIYNGHYWK